MDLVVVLEQRFERTPSGVWSHGAFDYLFWNRYLHVFDRVRIVARVRDLKTPSPGAIKSSGPGISFSEIPYYKGPLQYATRSRAVRRALRNCVQPGDAVILRVPSQLAITIAPVLNHDEHPYAVEVVGNPHDVFAPGGVKHPLRPFFRWWFSRELRRQCKGAAAAAYVTESTLQRQYPCPGYVTHYSSITLDDDGFVKGPRSFEPTKQQHHLILVGSLDQLYKGPDLLIEAVRALVAHGRDLYLTIVGDGSYRPLLEQQVVDAGLVDRVRFTGVLPAGSAVRDALDRADVFVLPSRTEGLPRAMIEAMARGLPCIGTAVGGIPELLPADDLVPTSDAVALASRIDEVITNPARMRAMSERNLATARDYHSDVLSERRLAFYTHLRQVTEDWTAARGRTGNPLTRGNVRPRNQSP